MKIDIPIEAILKLIKGMTSLADIGKLVLAFSLCFVWLKYKEISKWIEKLISTKGKVEKKERAEKLINHPIFLFLREWNSYRLNDIQVPIVITKEQEREKRLWNAKVLLRVKIEVFNTALLYLTKEFTDGFIKNDKEVLVKFMSTEFWYDLLDKGIVGYNRQAKNLGVSEFFIQKFDNFHMATARNIYKSVDETLQNKMFSEDEKVYNILSSFKDAFVSTLNHIAFVLTLNGELSEALDTWDYPKVGEK